MESVPVQVRLRYAVPSVCGGAFVWAFHERRGSSLRVAFTDVATRKRVKQAGGAWNPDRTVWQLRYDRVVALGLRRRIVTLWHPGLDAAGSSEKHPDADAGRAST